VKAWSWAGVAGSLEPLPTITRAVASGRSSPAAAIASWRRWRARAIRAG
jgi:hypothetical protein